MRRKVASDAFAALVGQAPTVSAVGSALDFIIAVYLPGQSIGSILSSQPNDTIVPMNSQNPGQSAGAYDTATIAGIVHAALTVPLTNIALDSDETHNQNVWNQVLYWLKGGTGALSAAAPSQSLKPRTSSGSSPAPILDLTGYTQVDLSNAALTPAMSSNLTIKSPVNISVTSSTKSITELLLWQTVVDPADAPWYYVTEMPFSISSTPARLGTASFVAFVLFSDMTYSQAILTYNLTPGGSPTGLEILDAPASGFSQGTSVTVHTSAVYPSGPINVTQAATHTTGSGTQNGFSVNAAGGITAVANGTDWLNVAYGGLTASAQITVGQCAYTLSPANQLVASSGGVATIQVSATDGCAWTAGGGDTWLTFSQASGTNGGTISLLASQNATGDARIASVNLGRQSVLVTQAATSCTYAVSPGKINAPASGASGTFTIGTTCPIVANSNQPWVNLVIAGTSVSYSVAANPNNS